MSLKIFVSCLALCLLATGLAHGQEVKKLKVTLYTDQDDKDDDETVTIEIIRVSDGKVIGSGAFGSGETWADQTEKRLELLLKEALPIKDKGKYKIKVSKSCARGYPNGRGWHFCVKSIDGVSDDGQVYKIRDRETDRVLLGKHRGRTGPTSTDWDLGN